MKRVVLYIWYSTSFWWFKFKFGQFGRGSRLRLPLQIMGSRNIYIDSDVNIGVGVWLAAVPELNSVEARLDIGRNTAIGNYNHIYCTKSIVIEESVLIADKVYIADNQHNFTDVNVPILSQGIKQLPEVVIGSGSWIGENVCIIGCSIGKNCVIGANSVVTRDIPDFSVAVGSPARVIKKYCFNDKVWKRVNGNDNVKR